MKLWCLVLQAAHDFHDQHCHSVVAEAVETQFAVLHEFFSLRGLFLLKNHYNEKFNVPFDITSIGPVSFFALNLNKP